MHYLTKRVNELPEDQKRTIIKELVSQYANTPKTKTDKYNVSLMADHTDEAVQRFNNYGQMQGLSSGYASIDEMTKGFVGGELTIIAGKTSYGKTTLATNIAKRIAAAKGRVLFVTLEMTHPELTSRYMALCGGVTDEYHTVAAHTLFQVNDELGWEDIDGLMAKAKEELDVELVIIDHLHYFTRELQNTAEDLGRITKEFKKNAQRHNLPVLLISHVRKTMNDSPATMNDLRGSSYIAQDADIVLMVGRNPEDRNQVSVTIEKNRNRGFNYDKDTQIFDFDGTNLEEYTNNNPWGTNKR